MCVAKYDVCLGGVTSVKDETEAPSVDGKLIQLGHDWTLEKSELFLSIGGEFTVPPGFPEMQSEPCAFAQAAWLPIHLQARVGVSVCVYL